MLYPCSSEGFPRIAHEGLRIDAKTVQDTVDEIKVGDAMHGVDNVFVGEAVLSKDSDIFLRNGRRCVSQLDGVIEQCHFLLRQTCTAVIFLNDTTVAMSTRCRKLIPVGASMSCR